MIQFLLDYTASFLQDFHLQLRVETEEFCVQPGQQPSSQDGRHSYAQDVPAGAEFLHDPQHLVRIFCQ